VFDDVDWDLHGLFGDDDFQASVEDPSTSSRKRKGSQAESSGRGNKTDPAQLEAQKRWRLKKMASMQDLEAELQAKASHFEALSAQNAALRNKLGVLESVLALREEYLGRLCATQQPQQATEQQPALQGTLGAQAALPAPEAEDTCHAPAELPTTTTTSAPTGSHTKEAGLEDLASVLAQRAAAGPPSIPALQRAVGLGLSDARAGAGAVGVAGAGAGPSGCGIPDPPGLDQPLPCLKDLPPAPLWTPAWMKRMKEVTPTQWQQWWLEFIRESSMFTLSAEAHGPGSQAHDQLCHVVSTYLGILDQVTLINPATYYDSLYVNMATGKREVPAPNHWAPVTRTVLSTPQQVRDCMAALSVFDEVMTGVMRERAALTSTVTEALAAGLTPGSTGGTALPGVPPMIPAPRLPGGIPRGGLALPSAGHHAPAAAPHTQQPAALGARLSGAGSAAGAVQAGGASSLPSSSALGAPASALAAGAAPASGAPGALGPANVDLGDLTTRLAKNVDKERAAHNLVSDFVVTRVLSVVQVAKAVAASYPYVPDVLAILREGVRLATQAEAAAGAAAASAAGMAAGLPALPL